jgi:hypothetical protein
MTDLLYLGNKKLNDKRRGGVENCVNFMVDPYYFNYRSYLQFKELVATLTKSHDCGWDLKMS